MVGYFVTPITKISRYFADKMVKLELNDNTVQACRIQISFISRPFSILEGASPPLQLYHRILYLVLPSLTSSSETKMKINDMAEKFIVHIKTESK